MKNLENYGVLEMNKKDIKDTEGGIIFTICFLIGVAALAHRLWTR
jgi:hypothetical protein